MTNDKQREKLATFAHSSVSRTILQAVHEIGGTLIDRPVSDRHPDWGTLKDASPADGLVAARAIELHAARKVREYIKDCRVAGTSWRKIGDLLNLQTEAKATDRPIADLAFEIAAGRADPDYMWRDRTFYWRCKACGAEIADHGPGDYPEPGRGSHNSGCKRLPVERRAYSAYCRERGW
jgi:hypothetical protein